MCYAHLSEGLVQACESNLLRGLTSVAAAQILGYGLMNKISTGHAWLDMALCLLVPVLLRSCEFACTLPSTTAHSPCTQSLALTALHNIQLRQLSRQAEIHPYNVLQQAVCTVAHCSHPFHLGCLGKLLE